VTDVDGTKEVVADILIVFELTLFLGILTWAAPLVYE
jgi:hypothetical protein